MQPGDYEQRPLSDSLDEPEPHDTHDESGEIDHISHVASKAGIILMWVVTFAVLAIFGCCAGVLFLNYAFGH
jgi:hypothetical protein